MKKTIITLLGLGLLVVLNGCTRSLLGTPTPLPTLITIPSPTPLLATPTTAAPLPTVPTPTVSVPTVTLGAPTSTTGSVPTPTTVSVPTLTTVPNTPSGPYGVILVAPGDVLNVRTGPGAGYAISGSFAATATNVMRTGPSSTSNGDLWVQVQNPGGGNGWVNAYFLTEMAPTAFCADSHVNTLLTTLGNALKTSNGQTLASLVSPAHGMAVRLWRYSAPIIFDREHARWVFDSTYEHNWGAAPGSGLDTVGAFHVVVLPKLLDVFNAPAPGYTLSCDAPQTGGASYDTSWPVIYTNVNFYSLYKPGPVGNENSWRTLLIGVEYVQGQPYVFSVTQMDWEP
ncbi:MAG TPA: hypothetical protein VF352_02640 [Anaerolineales bacterium]